MLIYDIIKSAIVIFMNYNNVYVSDKRSLVF